MTPTATRKGSRLTATTPRWTRSGTGARKGGDAFVRLNAGIVEPAVPQELCKLLRTPDVASRAIGAARQDDPAIDHNDVVAALTGFDGSWESLSRRASSIATSAA